MSVTSPLLAAEAVSVRFGGLVAVQDVSFAIAAGEIVGMIGPNGAGKTTTINAITGFVQLTSGSIRFNGCSIGGLRPELVARLGLVRTFQNAAMFASMSVFDNLATGAFLIGKAAVWQTLLRTRAFLRDERSTREHVERVLTVLELQGRRNAISGDLPYGEQRVLGLGIALMANPTLLLLDEPAAGLNPEEARMMEAVIRRVHDEGITVLLIEHNMSLVMSVSDRIIVLKQGQKLAEGTPQEIRRHPDVVEAYLGCEA